MDHVHIPLQNIKPITREDAQALHEVSHSENGAVLLRFTIGWRAAGLYAIENYLFHGANEADALALATAAHMDHVTSDVKEWLRKND